MRIFKNQSGSWIDLADILATGESFRNTTGKFRGELVNGPIPTGRMAKDEVDIMRARDADYVVYSYGTPIGYRAKGVWFSPNAGYSQTTKSKHLSRLRPAIGKLNGEF